MQNSPNEAHISHNVMTKQKQSTDMDRETLQRKRIRSADVHIGSVDLKQHKDIERETLQKIDLARNEFVTLDESVRIPQNSDHTQVSTITNPSCDKQDVFPPAELLQKKIDSHPYMLNDLLTHAETYIAKYIENSLTGQFIWPIKPDVNVNEQKFLT